MPSKILESLEIQTSMRMESPSPRRTNNCLRRSRFSCSKSFKSACFSSSSCSSNSKWRTLKEACPFYNRSFRRICRVFKPCKPMLTLRSHWWLVGRLQEPVEWKTAFSHTKTSATSSPRASARPRRDTSTWLLDSRRAKHSHLRGTSRHPTR